MERFVELKGDVSDLCKINKIQPLFLLPDFLIIGLAARLDDDGLAVEFSAIHHFTGEQYGFIVGKLHERVFHAVLLLYLHLLDGANLKLKKKFLFCLENRKDDIFRTPAENLPFFINTTKTAPQKM